MKPSLAFLGLALAGMAAAQSPAIVDYTQLPQCARGCTILQQAEANCVPPAAPVTSQAQYQSCYCQSALLTSLHSSGVLCQQFCPPDDSTKISTYYNALCNNPAAQPPPAPPPPPSPPSSTSTTTSTTNTATAGAAKGGIKPSNSDNYNWLDNHWKWVVMIVVIGVAMIFFWVGGFWLKRHLHRKREAQRASMAASEPPMGPPHDPHTPSPNGKTNGHVPTPSMTMSGGMDGGVGGIAPPRAKLRSRTNTLSSIGGHRSPNYKPPPVTWGPHQHQAHAMHNSYSGTPVGSIPPSPTAAMSPPSPPDAVYRNHDAIISEPRFVRYQVTPNSIAETPSNFSTPVKTGSLAHRPSTAGEAQGSYFGSENPVGSSRPHKLSKLAQ